ncbi:MAG: bifunctional [glutamate--ammonia ligase]-adenylyl-L-tyrosine phosphorylase/[glutamate--ammonia-ligase] adenylyltransferase [Gammaproteobacteria bacterium]|nr:MAG: bifunctional [glutamate--ammonia ligase]-adenylyl-L-tyrosine phosphorylase/[glutamate--ammonia-ligase] adenylyltransferase [Gammaproteobacteria bacterium]
MTTAVLSFTDAKHLCCAASDMVKHFAERHPARFAAMLNGIGEGGKYYDDYHRLLSKLIRHKNEVEAAKILRRFRVEQQVELACRDILGQISIEKVLRSLSDLASACLDVTYYYVYELLAKRHGVPLDSVGQQQHLAILGMGKLGGGELNFSSDIDLILAYPQKGETQGNEHGEKIIDNELFFHRLAQKLIRLLDKYDENGFVYRVDMRLKPFGSVGTLCTTFAAMKRYYLQHGRNWERYALVKMRAVAGNIAAGNALVDDLTPFIYQRHVDYEAVNSIEEMKTKIVANSHEKNLRDNLKLGQGGIREIEFLVQTFQMMYGGRMTELRGQSLLTALQALREKELLSDKVTEMLRTHYLRLRKIENAIQYYRDQQTHDLPNKTEPRKALLTALQIDDWLTLVGEVNRIRFEVFQLFQRVFATQDDNISHVDEEKLSEEYWLDLVYQTDITREGAETIAGDFLRFYQRMKNHDLGDKYLIRLNWVLPQVIQALDGEENPVKIAKHMLELLEAIIGESVYLSLLVEHPSVLKKIMHLFMHSSWMTRFLCKHPRVIDELIHETHEDIDIDAKSIRRELNHAISQSVGADAVISKLIDFKNAQMFRIASADLQNKIRLMHVSDHLTWTAEAIIKAVLQLAQNEMAEKYGQPTYELNGRTYKAQFGVIAYGKLGGLEMGYGSDLDLVFLHSSQGEKQQTNGERCVDNDVFFTRLVGKFNNYMTTLTPSGKLYEIDIRLRPSGQSGLLVHSLTAFAHYQQSEAWTWEHQALVRARFIAGGKAVKKGFKAVRRKVIAKDRNEEKLKNDVLKMREKMQQSQQQPDKGMVHVKHGRGGVTDIEFIVQYLLLKHSKDYRHLIRCSDNMRQLAALELFDILRSADAADLRSVYRTFRLWIHHQQLLGQAAIAPQAQFAQEMAVVQRIWHKVFAQADKR